MTFKPLALAAAAALGLAACATTQPHTGQSMAQGMHPMPHKGGYMRDKDMPSQSADCAKQALEKMSPDHRAMCQGKPAPK